VSQPPFSPTPPQCSNRDFLFDGVGGHHTYLRARRVTRLLTSTVARRTLCSEQRSAQSSGAAQHGEWSMVSPDVWNAIWEIPDRRRTNAICNSCRQKTRFRSD